MTKQTPCPEVGPWDVVPPAPLLLVNRILARPDVEPAYLKTARETQDEDPFCCDMRRLTDHPSWVNRRGTFYIQQERKLKLTRCNTDRFAGSSALLYALNLFFFCIIIEQNTWLPHAEVEDPGVHVVFDLSVEQ